jgi:hypothetical protein
VLLAVALAALVLAAAVAGFLAVRAGGDDDPPPATTSSSSTSSTTTTSVVPWKNEAVPNQAGAITAAEAEGRARDLQLQVVDTNAYRGEIGLSALVAEVPDGRRYVVVFYDGHLLGFDFAEPSWSLEVTDQTPDSLTVAYGLFAAGERPPAPPTGTKEIRFRWVPERGRITTENGPVPPTDPAVDGHR